MLCCVCLPCCVSIFLFVDGWMCRPRKWPSPSWMEGVYELSVVYCHLRALWALSVIVCQSILWFSPPFLLRKQENFSIFNIINVLGDILSALFCILFIHMCKRNLNAKRRSRIRKDMKQHHYQCYSFEMSYLKPPKF